MRKPPLRYCRAFAGTGLAATAFVLALSHSPTDFGVSAEQLAPAVLQPPAELAASALEDWTTGAMLLDFVEPGDGEGGSEQSIAAFVAELDAKADVAVQPAGFYSEGEHLYRVSASSQAWAQLELELREHPLVEGVEPEVIYALPQGATSTRRDEHSTSERGEPDANKGKRRAVNDPMFKLQWHMEQIHAPEAWADQRGNGVIVAVIDTGVAWKTAQGVRQIPDLAQTEFTAGESFISGLPDGLDDHAHGSHVAGTIAQSTDNGIGVTGVAHEATIMPLKVLSGDGRGSVPGIANAIRYAADHGAHVINMSLGGPLPSRVLAKAIEYAHDKGVTTVCAAGNESRGRVGYPAAAKHAIAVSATNYDRGLTFYSNYGKDIDVAAPGGDTRNDNNDDGYPDGVLQNTIKIQQPLENDYLWFQGTSMASPHAAGVAALIVAEGVTNPDEVERVLKASAVHPQGKKWDKKFGAGIIDAQAAVKLAHSGYAPERGIFALLLGLFALGGLGIARNRVCTWAAFGIAAAAASGALGVAPLAYQLATLTGTVGSGIWLSAAAPLALTLLALGYKPARPALAGLALGYAAVLAHGAIVLPTLLTGIPGGPLIDRLWLASQAVASLWLAARIAQRTR